MASVLFNETTTAFDKNPATSWTATATVYDGSSGGYYGPFSTSGSTSLGVPEALYSDEWLQMQLPPMILMGYSIQNVSAAYKQPLRHECVTLHGQAAR